MRDNWFSGLLVLVFRKHVPTDEEVVVVVVTLFTADLSTIAFTSLLYENI